MGERMEEHTSDDIKHGEGKLFDSWLWRTPITKTGPVGDRYFKNNL
jgi:hypothetical protein